MHVVYLFLQRGATGSGEEISQINALVFAKDFSAGVSPVDIKPTTEVNVAPRASEQQAAAAPASEARSTVGVNNTQQQGSSRPACSIHSCVSSLEGEKENATALTAQPLAVGVQQSLQQAIPLPYALPIVPSVSRVNPASNSPAKEKLSDPDTVSSLENGYNPGYARAATPDHQFEVRPRFSLADQMAGQQSKAEPQRSAATFIGRIDAPTASAPRQPQGASVSQEKQQAWQSQPNDHGTPGDASAASPSPPLPRIQGGVINVSSVYSQG